MLRSAKALARRTLPAWARRGVRDQWEDLRDWIDTFAFGLWFIATRMARPQVLVFFGFAPGDDLLCTAVLRELRLRGRDRLLIVSDHRELFIGNQDPAQVRPLWRRYSRYDSTVSICRRFVRIWGGEFRQPEYAPPDGVDRRRPPSRHVIVEMCARAGITGPVSIKPYLVLTEDEKLSAASARDQIVIQSSGLAARHPARNKEWCPERFQGVVDALHREVRFIQLGSATDPALRHTRDLRGATSIRQAAAILHQARLYVGLEGFLMHLARSVECPSVIIFGGRVAPWQIGYTCNFNLYSEMPCAPCWRANTCEFDHKCMRDISVADVVSAIRQMLLKPRGPLALDTAEIGPGAASKGPAANSIGHRGSGLTRVNPTIKLTLV
jgi:Glycosyltransferase family 9 (heptosyltransferase)